MDYQRRLHVNAAVHSIQDVYTASNYDTASAIHLQLIGSSSIYKNGDTVCRLYFAHSKETAKVPPSVCCLCTSHLLLDPMLSTVPLHLQAQWTLGTTCTASS